MRQFFLFSFLLLSILPAKAQFDLGAGGQVDFPLMFNKHVGNYNHTLGAFGPRVTFKYYPSNSTFFPSVDLHTTSVQLPLIRVEDLVVSMVFTQLNFIANMNLRKDFEKGSLHYGVGVGTSYLRGKGTVLTDNGQNNIATIRTDSSNYITRWMPFVKAGLEYVFPISQEKPLFVGIGGHIQYIYFFDGGEKYNVQLVNKQYQQTKLQPQLFGHMVTPGIYLNVYYRFNNKYNYY